MENYFAHQMNAASASVANGTFKERRGRFMIPRMIFDNRPIEAMMIMAYMAVYKAEYMMDMDCVEYWALSPLFDVLEFGERAPWYDIEFSEGCVRARRPVATVRLDQPR